VYMGYGGFAPQWGPGALPLLRVRGRSVPEADNAGKHLERIKLRTTSSEACLSILLKIELNEVKKELFALSKEHLNCRPLTKKTP